MTDTAIKLFKALADRSRLGIVHCLMDGEPKYVELLAEELKLAPSTVSFHLKKLEEAGLVSRKKEQYYVEYRLNKDVLQATVQSLVQEAYSDRSLQEERAQRYRQKVLDTFFQYGKLVSIPVQRKKRQIILEQLLDQFEQGRTYTEKEVNDILRPFHEDTATLRRELINERMLQRTPGTYWRP